MLSGNNFAKVLHYYGLLQGENEYKIVCPFHEDSEPSMIINLATGSFFCFGCYAKGDALSFVMLANPELNDFNACQKYYGILKSKKVSSINITKQILTQQKDTKDSEQFFIEAHDYYYCLKTTDWRAESGPEKAYMLRRGFTPDMLNKCKAKINYSPSYPVIFPMFDMGEFKGWVCRTIYKGIEKRRKYLYNKGFSRIDTLVGDYDAEKVMLVEGYMDRLKMCQFGAKKIAAILGWKITDRQIGKLKSRGVKTIISALDNDECGKRGTRYLEKFFNVIPFPYPKGVKDPGDMTKEQFENCRRLLKNEFNRQNERASKKVRGK